ncbi:ATPase [Thermotoga petrophila RKU-1]|uniref:ATPase n=2 Tax=Thermotoga petrophila TaxID=93929 RepID=A5ING8_THEP1|nr:ATP-binding protein [Thermotoga petrophila]ABQ47741.1 ATPase [Thermotoga petrophila RKU-1]
MLLLPPKATSDPGSDIIKMEVIDLLFSLTPKTKKEDLFDREKELKDLEKLLQTYPIVVITGLRRVGKSSLVKVFLNESDLLHITVDGRRLYETSGGNISSHHLTRFLGEELSRISKSQKLLNVLKRVRGITVSGTSIELNPKEFSLSDLLEKLNETAKRRKKKMVIFFDEAQYLRYYGSRGGSDLLALLAYSYDNFENVRFIISGSEVGVLHDFLKLEDYSSPLHGRGIGFLTVRPFTFDQSVDFLMEGFREVGEKVNFDVEEIVREIDGIVGYLVLFGVKYLEKKNKDEALKEVFHAVKALFEKEMEELRKRSERYPFILRQISRGINTWSALKNIFRAKGDFIGDSRLYSLLETLEKMSFIEKTQSGYRIVDPVFEKILSE